MSDTPTFLEFVVLALAIFWALVAVIVTVGSAVVVALWVLHHIACAIGLGWCL